MKLGRYLVQESPEQLKKKSPTMCVINYFTLFWGGELSALFLDTVFFLYIERSLSE